MKLAAFCNQCLLRKDQKEHEITCFKDLFTLLLDKIFLEIRVNVPVNKHKPVSEYSCT